jgi:putative spermidine/putrescine transport system permease protein
MTRALGRLALRATSAVSFALMLMPIFFISWLSFFKNEILAFPPEGYTLRWFSQLWLQPQFAEGFLTSLEVGLLATLGGLALGVPASIGLSRHSLRGGALLTTFLMSPLIVPSIVIGTALYIAFVEIEIATELPLTGSIIGLALAHILVTIPWTVRLLTASLLGFDRTIEEAAMNLGADLQLRRLLRQSRDLAVPRRTRTDDAADRDSPILGMEDRSDRRCCIADPDHHRRRRDADHKPVRSPQPSGVA